MSSFKRKNTDSGEQGPNSKRGTQSGGEKISDPPSPEDSGEQGPNSKRGTQSVGENISAPPSPEDSGEQGPNSKSGTQSGGEKISAPPSPEGKEISSQTGGGHCNCRTAIGFDDYNVHGYRVGAPEIATSGKAWTPCSIHGGCITPAPSVVIDLKDLPSIGKIMPFPEFEWVDPVPKKILRKH